MLNQTVATCATCPYFTALDTTARKGQGVRGTCQKLSIVTRSHWQASTNCKSAA